MRRSSSIRNYGARRKPYDPLIWVLMAAILLILGFTALLKAPQAPAALSHLSDKRAEERQLSQGAGKVSGLKNTFRELNAGILASGLSDSLSTQHEASGKLQSTTQINRLDLSVARNQLREPGKYLSSLGRYTEAPLIVYTFLDSADPENEANLRYYVREGIREDDRSSHIILVDAKQELRALPALQVENARYVKRNSKDCQMGALGSLLKSGELDISKFSSFVFLSSAVRGPFLPAHVKGLARWQQLLTSKLTNHTKLVGPVITCQDIVWPSTIPEKDRRHGQPHFPASMWATDKMGLDLMIKAGGVFQCHDRDVPNSEAYSMMTASTVILQNGFNLDSLLVRYQGVLWSEKETWGCNAGLKVNEGDHYYDGINLHPMEVMFVEVSSMMLQKGLSMAKAAKKYDRWRQAQVELKEDVTFNMYAFDPRMFRAPRIAYMEKRGPGCFDFSYYTEQNPELGIDKSNMVELWAQFVESGQFEDRRYRFNCLDILARSFNCFDTNYYNRANEDLNQLRLEGRPLSPQEAWNHFLETGYFESRKYRFNDICSDDLDSPNNLGEGI